MKDKRPHPKYSKQSVMKRIGANMKNHNELIIKNLRYYTSLSTKETKIETLLTFYLTLGRLKKGLGLPVQTSNSQLLRRHLWATDTV